MGAAAFAWRQAGRAHKSLIPDMDEWESLVEYGSERVRALCAEREVNWETRSDGERQAGRTGAGGSGRQVE